jgi:hypothetical protein
LGGGAGDGFAIIFYQREGDGDGYRLEFILRGCEKISKKRPVMY